MVKIIKSWGVNWVKSTSKDDKPQEQAFNNRENNDDLIVKSHSKKYGHIFANMGSDVLLGLINKNRGLYEIIEVDRRKKVYFDVDNYDDIKNLDEIIAFINDFLPNADINISGSTSLNKISYHIIVNNYYIPEGQESLAKFKLFINSVSDDLYIDKKVYTKNRAMKCINQKKVGRNDTQEYISGSEDLKDHLITCFFPEECFNVLDFINVKIQDDTKTLSNGNKIYTKLDLSTIKSFQKGNLPNDFDILTAKPINIIMLIPNPERQSKYSHSHNIIWIVGVFCKHNKVSFPDFWQWCKQKDDSIERKTKWYDRHWTGSLENSENWVDRNTILRILERYYINVGKDINYRSFYTAHNIIPTKIIENKYFDVSDFTKKKYQLLDVPMGSGKTHATSAYLKKNNENSFIWITPRITLAMNTKQRLLDDNIEVSYYSDIGKSKKEKYAKMPLQDKLIIQCESLHYLKDSDFDIVVIDEIESVLNCWSSEETHGENLSQNWDVFKHILINCKKCILLDAFLSKKTFTLLNDLGIDKSNFEVFKSSYKTPPKKIVYLNGVDSYVSKIEDKLKNGNKCFVLYPYKKGSSKHLSIGQLCNYFIKKCDITKDDIIVYSGDSSDSHKKKLKSANKEWFDKKLVITTSCITVGVDYNNNNFDYVFISYVGFLKTRDIIQTSARIRNTKTNTIYCGILNKWSPKDYKRIDINDDVYDNLLDNIYIEDRNCTIEALNYYSFLSNYIVDETEMIKKVNVKILDEIVGMDMSQCSYNWNYVKSIDKKEAKELYIKSLSSTATQDEKIELMKYKFEYMFNKNTSEMSKLRMWIPSNQRFFTKYINMYVEKQNILMKILNNNKYTLLSEFLNEDKDEMINNIQKLSISDEEFNDMCVKYSFNRCSKNKNNLFVKALNAEFGYNIIDSKYIKETKKTIYKSSNQQKALLTETYAYAFSIKKSNYEETLKCMFD